jgi:two-component system, LytTR family, response regulator
MKAIIVEDEQLAAANLLLKLKDNCPSVEVIDTCDNGEEAIKKIDTLRPDLVFLDVRLGSMTGFDVLARLSHVDFEVIITTAYDNYAIDAIKNSALDYLLKPFTDEELKQAVDKAWRALNNSTDQIKQIAVPVEHGIRLIKCADIIWCEADDNYSKLHLASNGQILRIPRKLSDVYQKLPRYNFFKAHRSHIVNRDFIAEFSRDGLITMTNKKMLSLSKSNKDEFLAWLGV